MAIKLVSIVLVWLTACCVNGEVAVERSVEESVMKADHPHHPGHKFLTHTYKLASGVGSYQVNYRRCQSPEHANNPPHVSRGAVDLLSGIGFVTPKGIGWYWHSCVDVVVNGISLGSYQASTEPILDDNRGGVRFLWELPQIRISIDFFMVSFRDGLYAVAEINPECEVKTIRVSLCCFPSIYRRDGKRAVICGEQEFVQGTELRSFKPGTDEHWFFYKDEIYDASAPGKGRGPCAVVFDKGVATGARLNVSAYSVHTDIDYPAMTRKIKLCFFEFQSLPNPDAKEYFLRQLPLVVDEFSKLD